MRTARSFRLTSRCGIPASASTPCGAPGFQPKPGAPYLVVLWPDQVLSLDNPPTAPKKYVESNRYLRERMTTKFGRVQLARVSRQADGFPLLEIWRAEMRLTQRLRPKGDRRGPGEC